jgi:hypothetical protein
MLADLPIQWVRFIGTCRFLRVGKKVPIGKVLPDFPNLVVVKVVLPHESKEMDPLLNVSRREERVI